jgi:hypothetical protein
MFFHIVTVQKRIAELSIRFICCIAVIADAAASPNLNLSRSRGH